MDLKDPTVGEILDQLCKADPRYTYEFSGETFINVFPLGAKVDPTNLLNLRVKHAVINEKRRPEVVIRRIPDFAPELAKYLEDMAKEQAKRTGIPYGTVGSRMRGNMDPQISLEFRNMTVREILNAVSLFSADLYRKDSHFAAVSWKYEFVVDPKAATGLGGYPKWDVF
ncbi:MAG: hypothetical protein L0387_17135 [Acidobacteria bacterium]|nr:hypothetical protein [Acidobacteriota bacterium]MCI0719525.1 hypothetical protein [Acidobacteriota bacterium]